MADPPNTAAAQMHWLASAAVRHAFAAADGYGCEPAETRHAEEEARGAVTCSASIRPFTSLPPACTALPIAVGHYGGTSER